MNTADNEFIVTIVLQHDCERQQIVSFSLAHPVFRPIWRPRIILKANDLPADGREFTECHL